jgi:hypothetical protein
MIRAYPEEIIKEYPQNSNQNSVSKQIYIYYPEDQTFKLMVMGLVIVSIVAIVAIVAMVKK